VEDPLIGQFEDFDALLAQTHQIGLPIILRENERQSFNPHYAC